MAAGGVAREILTGLGTGFLLGILFCTPVGWVAVIGTAIAEGVGISLASLLGEKLGDASGEIAHETYDWAKKELGRWL